jgi:hypothetical protein
VPKGPKGQKRPADVIGNAVRVMQIATGEIAEDSPEPGKEYARKGGLKGGPARAAKLNAEQRHEIAKKGARSRWSQAEGQSASVALTVSTSRKARKRSPKSRSRKD